jgi:hypothetical protein
VTLSWVRPLFLASLVGLASGLAHLEVRLSARVQAGTENAPTEAYYVPPASTLRALAFGYNELAADLLWVRSIAYYANHITTDRDLRHIERYLNTIVALDPHFRAIYRYGPPMIVGRGSWRENPHVLAGIELLKRAHALWPEDWSYPFAIGAYLLDLRGTQRERAEWKRQAADWINRAALIGADAPWLPSIAAKFYSEQGQRELAIRHLEEIYLTTQDPRMKEQIVHKLRDLQAARIAELEQAAAQLLAALRQSPTPYVPLDLFVFLQQAPFPPFTLARPSPSSASPR